MDLDPNPGTQKIADPDPKPFLIISDSDAFGPSRCMLLSINAFLTKKAKVSTRLKPVCGFSTSTANCFARSVLAASRIAGILFTTCGKFKHLE